MNGLQGEMEENRGINERGRGGKRLIKNINPKSPILYSVILAIYELFDRCYQKIYIDRNPIY